MQRDLGVTEWIRSQVPEWLELLAVVLTALGDWLVIIPLLALVYVVDVALSLRDGEADEEAEESAPLCSNRTVVLVGAVFGGLVTSYLLKSFIAAPRPPTELHVSPAGGWGFPSGHATSATVFWGAVAIWVPVSTRKRRFAIAGLIVAVVALTRLVLGVHFLVDVIAGIAIGSVYLTIFWVIANERPWYAMAIAGVLAALAVIANGPTPRSLMALGGVLVAAGGWRVVESTPVRTFLTRRVGPLLDRTTRVAQERI